MDTMNADYIEVPELLLTSPKLLPSAKLVWIVLMLDSCLEARVRHSCTRLAKRTGLSRPTIYASMAELMSGGWYSKEGTNNKGGFKGRSAIVYIDLLMDKTLSIQARLFHGLLQLTSGFKEHVRNFKYSILSGELHMCVKTARKAVGQLVDKGWLVIKQANQLAPIFFDMHHPIKEQFDAIFSRIIEDLFDTKYIGEALMKGFLSLLVPIAKFIDNSKPDWLRNVKTGKLMEHDRIYISGSQIVAFEFNGNQHYAPTDRYDAATVKKQQHRDGLKKQICSDEEIALVIIRPQDLTLNGMLAKIGNLLPLRDLHGGERIIRFLDERSAVYIKNTPIVAANA